MNSLRKLANVAAGAERLETNLEKLARTARQMEQAAAAAAEQAHRQAALAESAKIGSHGVRYYATESARAKGPPSGKHGGGRRRTKRTRRSKRSKRTRRR